MSETAKRPPSEPHTLERKISAALATSSQITATELAALVSETEPAIIAADATAAREKEQAFDPALTPDPVKARQAMEDALFAADRLRTLLPRLQCKYAERFEREEAEAWLAKAKQVEAARDRLAIEFRGLYEPLDEPLAQKLVDLLGRMQANDAEISALHGERPTSVSVHLRNAELEARGLDSFGLNAPSILKNLVVPDWLHSDRNLWPKLQSIDPSYLIPATRGDPRLTTPDWWEVGDEQRANEQQRQQREGVAAEGVFPPAPR